MWPTPPANASGTCERGERAIGSGQRVLVIIAKFPGTPKPATLKAPSPDLVWRGMLVAKGDPLFVSPCRWCGSACAPSAGTRKPGAARLLPNCIPAHGERGRPSVQPKLPADRPELRGLDQARVG